jgi:hypothetical protein
MFCLNYTTILNYFCNGLNGSTSRTAGGSAGSLTSFATDFSERTGAEQRRLGAGFPEPTTRNERCVK